MIRLLALLIVILFPCSAWATTTWAESIPDLYSTATCTTGTESAPTLATQGLQLNGLSGFVVSAETAGTMTAGGTLNAYLWNPISEQWNRAPDLDLTASAVADQAWAGFAVASPRASSRVAFVPSGIGVAVTIYIVGTR